MNVSNHLIYHNHQQLWMYIKKLFECVQRHSIVQNASFYIPQQKSPSDYLLLS